MKEAGELRRVRFWGCEGAELFGREVEASLEGTLALSYVAEADGEFPAGFVHASPPGQYWSGTMWTRDVGTFLRELVLWGCYGHACQTANCLIDLVSANDAGFLTFPEYFRGAAPRSAFELAEDHTYPPPTSEHDELDGTAAIAVSMALLWRALPEGDETRARVYAFVHGPASPLRDMHAQLRRAPLLAGEGEFGGGAVRGLYHNVVQNSLAMLALLAWAGIEREVGAEETALAHRAAAAQIRENLPRYLLHRDGTWRWCALPGTLEPPPAGSQALDQEGSSQLNGVLSMYADVLGVVSERSEWAAMDACQRTFDALYAAPRRRELFDRYGIWLAQADQVYSSASYAAGYALQAMLLLERLDMAGKGLDWLAKTTYRAEEMGVRFDTFTVGRRSPWFFFERYPSPEAPPGRLNWVSGCGPLNLVNVAEPLKVARMIVGVDDTAPGEVKLVPRLPPTWQGAVAENWPIRTSRGVVRAEIRVEREGDDVHGSLRVRSGARIPRLAVRLVKGGQVAWQRVEEVSALAG